MPLYPVRAEHPAADAPAEHVGDLEGGPATALDHAEELEQPGELWCALQSQASEHLLRGVTVATSLEGFGRHWSGVVTGGVEHSAEEFGLSRDAIFLDDFVSHDWCTGRWPKYWALCLIYNGHAAFHSSIVASLTAGLLQVWRQPFFYTVDIRIGGKVTQPYRGFGATVVGPLVFWIVLISWQHLRPVLLWLTPRIIFVDKLCINQSEPEAKAAAIRSIAGFLRQSRRLVLLWSPHYLTRLWCVFEVATWVHLSEQEEEDRPTVFMPVTLAVGLLVGSLSMTAFFAIYTVQSAFFPTSVQMWPLVMLSICFIITVPSYHAFRPFVRDLKHMPDQLATFSVRGSECFCCMIQHRHPLTGEVLMCDRKLVYSALKRWFSDRTSEFLPSSDTDEAHLDRFDSCVRNDFRSDLLRRLQVDTLDYWKALIVSAPAWWYGADRISSTYSLYLEFGPSDALRYFCELACGVLIAVPLFAQLLWRSGFLLDSLCGNPANRLASISVTLLGTSWVVALLALLTLPGSLAQGLESPLPQALNSVAQICVAVALFCKPRCWPKAWSRPTKAEMLREWASVMNTKKFDASTSAFPS